jgi:hypothetical protein
MCFAVSCAFALKFSRQFKAAWGLLKLRRADVVDVLRNYAVVQVLKRLNIVIQLIRP